MKGALLKRGTYQFYWLFASLAVQLLIHQPNRVDEK